MLGKLLKYDLKWIYKVVIIFYALSFIFAILTRICFSIENSMLFSILAQIASGFTISMIASSLINSIMRSWVRLVNNIYKDESYLTHTLPVNKKTIYLSKVLAAIICSFLSIVVVVSSLFICYYSKENIEFLKQALELTANTYDTTVINLLFVVSFIIFLEIVFIILIGYVGIIIGHKANRNKILKSIVISFGLYMGTNLLTVGIVALIAVFNQEMMNLIKTTEMISTNTIKLLLLVAILIYTGYNLFYYWLGKKQFEKGVNVD